MRSILSRSLASALQLLLLQACGSGGTTAGIALGNHLSGYGARVWAFGVCDDPDYFLDHIDGLFRDLGAPEGGCFPKRCCRAGRCVMRRHWCRRIRPLMNGSIPSTSVLAGVRAGELVTVVQAKGSGYAISQSDELQVMKDVAEATGWALPRKHHVSSKLGG